MSLVCIAALAGCGGSGSSASAMKSDAIPVNPLDPEMNAAMQTARSRFPEFWREVSKDYKRAIPALGGSMVKAYFNDVGAPTRGEHMWVRDVQYYGKQITGVLSDTPRALRSVRSGDRVSFSLERLSDWFYVEDGKAVGAFTVRLLRNRMSAEQRREHDSHYPFRFD